MRPLPKTLALAALISSSLLAFQARAQEQPIAQSPEQTQAQDQTQEGEGPGDRGGNGGTGIVCRYLRGPKKGEPKTVQLLDLAEFEGLVPESSDDVDTQFDGAMKRLSDAGLDSVAKKIIEKDRWISNHTGSPYGGFPLTYKNDTKNRVVKTYVTQGLICRQEQIAVFNIHTGMLSRVKELYDLLSKTGKTAFRIHEAAYAIAAEQDGVEDSELTRQFVRAILNPGSSPFEYKKFLPFKLFAKEELEYLNSLPNIPVQKSGEEYDYSDFLGDYIDLAGTYLLVRFGIADGLVHIKTLFKRYLGERDFLNFTQTSSYQPNAADLSVNPGIVSTKDEKGLYFAIIHRGKKDYFHRENWNVNLDGTVDVVRKYQEGIDGPEKEMTAVHLRRVRK